MANVPRAPGVPNLPSYSGVASILAVVDVLLPFPNIVPQWGIFLNGAAVIAADNTISFELRQDFPLSNFPVEQGGFQTYNKVQLPSDIRVTVSCGGSIAKRQAFLASIDAVMNTTSLYDVVTPEQTYVGYNFMHRDFRRTAKNGATLITVDLWLQQIKESASASFQKTQQPGVSGQQGVGNLQAFPPAARIQQNLTNGTWQAT